MVRLLWQGRNFTGIWNIGTIHGNTKTPLENAYYRGIGWMQRHIWPPDVSGVNAEIPGGWYPWRKNCLQDHVRNRIKPQAKAQARWHYGDWQECPKIGESYKEGFHSEKAIGKMRDGYYWNSCARRETLCLSHLWLLRSGGSGLRWQAIWRQNCVSTLKNASRAFPSYPGCDHPQLPWKPVHKRIL